MNEEINQMIEILYAIIEKCRHLQSSLEDRKTRLSQDDRLNEIRELRHMYQIGEEYLFSLESAVSMTCVYAPPELMNRNYPADTFRDSYPLNYSVAFDEEDPDETVQVCPNCGKNVSCSKLKCPHCGVKLR